MDIISHIKRQINWSTQTFGPGDRTIGVVDHIQKELKEIRENPNDLEEWIDVIILAIDGAWRSGHTAEEIVEKLQYKQAKNESRRWPDWRNQPTNKAIEHIRDE